MRPAATPRRGGKHAPRPGPPGSRPLLPFPSLSAGNGGGQDGGRRVPTPRRPPPAPRSPGAPRVPGLPEGGNQGPQKSPSTEGGKGVRPSRLPPPPKGELRAPHARRGLQDRGGGGWVCSPAQPQQRLCCRRASPAAPPGTGSAVQEGKRPRRHPSSVRVPCPCPVVVPPSPPVPAAAPERSLPFAGPSRPPHPYIRLGGHTDPEQNGEGALQSVTDPVTVTHTTPPSLQFPLIPPPPPPGDRQPHGASTVGSMTSPPGGEGGR